MRMLKKRWRDDGGRKRITVDYYYVNIEVAFILPPYARCEKLTYNSGSESRNHRDGPFAKLPWNIESTTLGLHEKYISR